MDFNQMFVKILNRKMAELNFTQNDVIEKCKRYGVTISKGQMSKIINGIHSPRVDKAEAIAKAIGFKSFVDMLK